MRSAVARPLGQLAGIACADADADHSMPASTNARPATFVAHPCVAVTGPVLCEARAIDVRCAIVRCQLSLFARLSRENGPIRMLLPGSPAALEFSDSLGR